MPYKLRFVQKFMQGYAEKFLEMETEFINLEKLKKEFPLAKRYIPLTGKEPVNTMIWEAEFESLENAITALHVIQNDDTHDDLFTKQSKYMIDSYTEIYRSFE